MANRDLSKNNQDTIQSYERHVQEYIAGTPQTVDGEVKKWIDQTLTLLSPSAQIFEIGSAFGRDADYIEAQGFIVQRTDAVSAFVDFLKSQGTEADIFNVLIDNFTNQYDLIFADAVLLHLTRQETEVAVQKIYSALKPKGIFSFSLKEGSGEEWSDAKLGALRYFCYWCSADIHELLAEVGFAEIVITNNDPKWLHVIARR